jgi:toluene monooxygenase electron transfer component
MKMSASEMHRISIRAPSGSAAFSADAHERLLDAGLRAGLSLPYECASGTCGQCSAKLVSGEVHNRWPEAPAARNLRPGQGNILLCQSTACSDLELALPNSAIQVIEPPQVPEHRVGRVTHLGRLNADVIELKLALSSPMHFVPGQFIVLEVPGLDGVRAYSMVNEDDPADAVTLLIKRKPDGGFSNWLFTQASPDTHINVFGPLGKATYDAVSMQDIICLAGGSGLAGMMAILGRIHRERNVAPRRADVFFGVRTAEDLFYTEALNMLADSSDGRLRITVALSDEVPEANLSTQFPALHFAHGMVHDVAMRDMRTDLTTPTAFLAGPPVAVDAGIRMLMKQKIPLSRIRFDRFG